MNHAGHAARRVFGMDGVVLAWVTAVDWITDTTGRTPTLTMGAYQAMVWHTSTGEWMVMISRNGMAVAHQRCLTLKLAQRWCEAQLRKLMPMIGARRDRPRTV